MLPNGITTLDSYAVGAGVFDSCDKLETVVLPDSLTTIGCGTFSDCRSLKTIVLPENVMSIGAYAFRGSGLTSISIPLNVLSIERYAFGSCDDLETVYYDGTQDEWDEIYIEEGNDVLKKVTLKQAARVTLYDANGEKRYAVCELGKSLSLSDIEAICGYHVTLYSDAAMTQPFDLSTPITEHITFYVKLGDKLTNCTDGHSATYVEAVSATCTADGNVEYWHCSECGKNFSDEDCTNEITDVIVPATGHDFTDNAEYCRNGCGAENPDYNPCLNGHSFTNYISDGNATCTEDGTKTAKCDHCDETDTIVDVGSATGHDFSDNAEYCRNGCGAENPDYNPCLNGHSFTNYVSDGNATCTEDGTKTAKCDHCDGTNTIADVGSATGHDFSDNAEYCRNGCGAENPDYNPCLNGHSFTNYVSDGNATCTEDGTKTAKCDHCDETDTITDVGSATGHDWQDATCTEPKTCRVCGETEGEALGHDWQDATCTEPKTCRVCGETEGEALGHDFGDNLEYCARGCGTKNPNYIAPANPPYTPVKPTPTPTPTIPNPDPTPDTNPSAPVQPENPFADVKKNDYFFDTVIWNVQNGITTGTSATTFNPNKDCTRAELVTFLWRSAGKPEPTTRNNPFTDVKHQDYFYKAVLWAVENGITMGTSPTTFSPNESCTRAQAVTFLWRMLQGIAKDITPVFRDVPVTAYYAEAVAWALENGITNGIGNDLFGSEQICTRAQIVTLIYRALAK